MTAPAEDAHLVAAHLDGDREAFATLFQRHRDVLWAVALRMTGNPEDAADAVQDAMVSALRAVGGFQGRSAVRTWLYRIVVNACIDRLRRSSSRRSVPLEGHDVADPRQDPTQSGERLDVARALATLSPGQRAAVVLVDGHGLPVAEVADILEVPVGTVKSRCARARAHLATELGGGHGAVATGPRRNRPRGSAVQPENGRR